MRDIHMPIGVDDVVIAGERREVDPAAVKRIADSIKSIGLKHPITVRRKGEQYILVAGLHRLEAHRKLKLDHIPACIVSMTNAEARMWEIAENLHRAELTKLQRSENIAEWVRLCDEERKKDISAENPPKVGRPESGANAASRELGIERTTVQDAIRIADNLTPEAKDAAEEAGIDNNQSKLLAVAREPEERQVAKVYELKGVPLSKNWRDQFQTLWGKGTEDDHAWARDYMDKPIMDARHG